MFESLQQRIAGRPWHAGLYAFGVLALATFVLLVVDYVLRPESFPVRNMSFEGEFQQVDQQTLAMAKRLLTLSSDQERIASGFESVLNRAPAAEESNACLQYVQQAAQTATLSQLDPQETQLRAWQSYCRVLLSSNEFAYVE